MDNKKNPGVFCAAFYLIERLEETLRMRSSGAKVRLQVSK